MVFREHAEKVLPVFIERGTGDTHHELRQVLAADARAAEQLVHPRIAHRRGGGAQRLGPGRQVLVGLGLLECRFGVGPRDGGLFSHCGPPRIFDAALTAIWATSRRSASRACAASRSICSLADANSRAPSAVAVPLASSTMSLARCCAWSMI